METLKVRTINYTPALWEFYKHKAEIIYEKNMPSMIRIHEVQRSDFLVKFTVFMDNSGKQGFNKLLDMNEAQRMDQLEE